MATTSPSFSPGLSPRISPRISPGMSPGLSPHASPMLIPISPGLRYPYYQSLASTLSSPAKSPSAARILPSTSAISLLSLDFGSQTHNITDDDGLQFEFCKEPSSDITSPSPVAAPARRRNSLQQHYNQRRHQHYRGSVTPNRLPTKPVPAISPPDSPGLDPTSLCGSPTVLFLSSSLDKSMLGEHDMNMVSSLTGPPSGVGVKKRKKNRPQFLALPKMSSIPYGGLTVPAVHEEVNENSEDCDGEVPDSPNLEPVRSPKFDPPMTPLVLENDSWLDSGRSEDGE